MKRITAIIALVCLPFAVSAEDLSTELSAYVTSFDVEAIGEDAQGSLHKVMQSQSLNHGMKVLIVHEILLREGALGHVNVHGAEFPEIELSSAD